MKIPIEISAHHIHLCKKDLEILFGKNYKLGVLKHLSQKKQFAAKETVILANANFRIESVRILGPVREKTQVEISKTEAKCFGINSPLRQSGDLDNLNGELEVIGSKGKIDLKGGIIIPLRHIHASPTDAIKHKLKDKQIVSVKVEGERGLIFYNVMVRINPFFVWRMHLDTDEANAAGLETGEQGEVIV